MRFKHEDMLNHVKCIRYKGLEKECQARTKNIKK